jgi:hypothetical protein
LEIYATTDPHYGTIEIARIPEAIWHCVTAARGTMVVGDARYHATDRHQNVVAVSRDDQADRADL